MPGDQPTPLRYAGALRTEGGGLRVVILEALKRLYRWEETAGGYGQIDPYGISLITGRTEAEIREILADLEGEGLIEDSPAAGFGQTATEGWARITAAGPVLYCPHPPDEQAGRLRERE